MATETETTAERPHPTNSDLLPDFSEIPAFTAIPTTFSHRETEVANNDPIDVLSQPCQRHYSPCLPYEVASTTGAVNPALTETLPAESRPSSISDMQPPPAKRQRIHNYDRRPRLSICPSVSPDAELVEDRDRNDNTLKGKFEAIFEKYGRDFTDIGDEINVMTGEVMVDNGHILSMQDETDPGSPSRAKPRVYRQSAPIRRNNRSVTVGVEEVITSIEIMAKRVATGMTPYLEDDQGFQDMYESGDEVTYRRAGSVSSDSLLGIGGDDDQDEWASPRFGSPDSLLGQEGQESSLESFFDDQGMAYAQHSDSGSRNEPILLSSGSTAVPKSGPSQQLVTTLFASHGHPVAPLNTSRLVSPPVFVKSNGKSKIVSKKFNVSKAYEELQRQASSTPAINLPQPDLPKVVACTTKSSRAPARPKPLPREATFNPLPERTQPNIHVSDSKSILKRLPAPRPSSEPATTEGDYESDDPLQ